MQEFVGGLPADAVYPLGPGQRWLTAAASHDPVMARPVQRVYSLRHGFRPADLLAAVRHVVWSHPSLRMRVVDRDNQLAQRFDNTPAGIHGVSVQGRTAPMRAAYAHHLMQEQARRPLDLHREPPIHLLAVEVDGDQFLGVAIDHRAADDIGMDNFEHELTAAWAREADGSPHPLVDQTTYLAALWEDSREREREDENLEWWLGQLRGAPLATDSENIEWVPGSTKVLVISQSELSRLETSCRKSRVPLSAALLAAQLAWWRRRAPSPDMVVNLPVSNRLRPAEHGWIANRSMLLHPRFPSSLDEHDLIGIRDVLLEAMRHRHYDYAGLSAAISEDAAARGGRHSWLTGISYVVERRPSAVGAQLLAERLDDQEDSEIAVPRGTFSLAARQSATGLVVRAEWDDETWTCGPVSFSEEFADLLADSV